MARASVFNKIQFGVETTPGTEVAADKRLLCTYMRPRPRNPGTAFRPVGNLFNTDRAPEKGFTEIDLTGQLAFNDFVYILAGCLCVPTGTGIFTFKPNAWSPNAIKTYSIQHGSSVQAEKFNYGILTGFSFNVSPRGTIGIRGTGMGRIMAESATLTANPTDIPKQLVSNKGIDVYVADTVAGLGAGKLTKGFEVGWNFANHFNGLFTLDSAQNSFTEHVEVAPDFGANLRIEHDSYSAGLMADVLTAKQKFLRMIATGPEYGVGTPYQIQITMPFIGNEPDPGDFEGAHSYNYALTPDYETTFASGIEIIIKTPLTGL